MKTLLALLSRRASRWLAKVVVPLAMVCVPSYGYLLSASDDVAVRAPNFVPQPVVCGVRG